jgi:site-specific recombinase XerD
MNKAQQNRYDSLYQRHVNALRRQGKSKTTVDSYGRALRRITDYFDRCPDRLTVDDLKEHFGNLVNSHSWSTVKVDRNGLQFFYKHVLNKKWLWVDIVKPPEVKTLPDILTPAEISRIINAAQEVRYRIFVLTVYSMGLRLGEAINLTVADIDAERRRVHIRCGKGRKDRFVTLPDATLVALRQYWTTHRHRRWLFPSGKTPIEQHRAKAPMSRSGVQRSFKAIAHSCNIHKQVTIHSLRHCYGTHLVEEGLNLRAIQRELGHASPKTTALYTQLTDKVQQDATRLINTMVGRLSIASVGRAA